MFGNVPPFYTNYNPGAFGNVGASTAAGTATALTWTGTITMDTGVNPVFVWNVVTAAAGPVVTRPIWDWRNNNTSMLQLLPLNSGANACLSFGSPTGSAAPATGAAGRSAGTRVVNYANQGVGTCDYGFGIESSAQWYAGGAHKFYNAAAALLTSISSTGLLNNTGSIFATGSTSPAAGVGAAMDYNGGVARFLGFNYSAIAYTPVAVDGLSVAIKASGVAALTAGAGGVITLTPSVATSGSPTALTLTGAAHTTLAASTEDTDVLIDLSATKQFATGTIAFNRDIYIKPRTLAAVGASTITNAATLYIEGAPIRGANVTTTNAYAIWTRCNSSAGAKAHWRMDQNDDAVGNLIFDNSDNTGGVFTPEISSTTGSTNQGLLIKSGITTDSGANPALIFQAFLSGVGSMVSRTSLIAFQNYTTTVVSITPAGGMKIQGGTAPSLTVGASGTAITQTKVYSQTITPASVGALGASGCVQTFTVTGLTTADKVSYNHGSAYANGVGDASARCSAADTLEVTYYNTTAGALTPAAGTALILATRS